MGKSGEPDKKAIFIDLKYTLSFAVRFLGMASAGFLLLGASLFWVLNRRLGTSYFQDITTLSNLQEKLQIILFTTGVLQVVVLSLVFSVISLFWAHKVSGPIVRFRRYLNMLGKADLMDDMAFRQDDQLQYLAQAFRKTQASCKMRNRQLMDYLKEADQIVEEYEALQGEKGVEPALLDKKLLALKAVYKKIQKFLRRENNA